MIVQLIRPSRPAPSDRHCPARSLSLVLRSGLGYRTAGEVGVAGEVSVQGYQSAYAF